MVKFESFSKVIFERPFLDRCGSNHVVGILKAFSDPNCINIVKSIINNDNTNFVYPTGNPFCNFSKTLLVLRSDVQFVKTQY